MEHINGFFKDGQNAEPGKPELQAMPEMPTAPQMPADYDPEEARTNPGSSSARYLREYQQFQVDISQFNATVVQRGVENNEITRKFYEDQDRQRQEAAAQQAQQNQQFNEKQAARVRIANDLRVTQGLSDAQIMEFFKWSDNPDSFSDLGSLVAAWQHQQRGAQAAQAQTGLQNPQPMQQNNPANDGRSYQGNLQNVDQGFRQPVGERYPRSPAGVGQQRQSSPDFLYDTLLGGLKEMSDQESGSLIVGGPGQA